ncbi:MAG TPA: vitamin B12-dependent ribonucleotide reductase, partial [Verrucomicrobia bacterium]|nr:vitamin B12-dependent ribonucleotide reductase [Verrucomicrobiota bacterium]
MIDANDSLTAPTSRSPRRSTSPKVTTPKRGSLAKGKPRQGIKVERVFSDAKRNPYDEIEWDNRTAEITDEGGNIIFKQEDVEVPKNWSQLATKVVVSKYFFGQQDTPERETSVRQLVHRVARTIADWGVNDGYFSKKDGEVFYEELSWLCLNQYGAFNSPVWFNVGLHHEYGVGTDSAKGNWHYEDSLAQAKRATSQYEYPQGSACFIQSV